MEVAFRKNFRISVFDLILIGISVPDFSLKIKSRTHTNKKAGAIRSVYFQQN